MEVGKHKFLLKKKKTGAHIPRKEDVGMKDSKRQYSDETMEHLN